MILTWLSQSRLRNIYNGIYFPNAPSVVQRWWEKLEGVLSHREAKSSHHHLQEKKGKETWIHFGSDWIWRAQFHRRKFTPHDVLSEIELDAFLRTHIINLFVPNQTCLAVRFLWVQSMFPVYLLKRETAFVPLGPSTDGENFKWWPES